MEDNKKTYDFFAALAKNPNLGVSDLKQLGISPETAELKSKSDYENMPQVREFFAKPDGTFNTEAFNKFYDNALLAYNNYAMASYTPSATELFGYVSSDWDRPSGSTVLNTAPYFKEEEFTPDQSIGIDFIDKYGQGIYANKTYKEVAESQKVVDYRTGEELDWTPEDKGGLFKGLVRPNIVLATYDKDETVEENGRMVTHKKGDIKFNKNGRPYAELLGDRDIRDKQLIGYSDTITKESSAWNKYDFFDSDDYDKSFIGTVAKLAVRTVPYFIPGVQYIAGGLTALEAAARVLPVIGKAINGVFTDDADNEFGRTMNQLEAFWARFDPTVTQRSQEHLVTFENFGNLVGAISGQLFQQKAVGMLPMWLTMSENTTQDVAKIGRALSYGYMAATSSQDSYNIAKQAGASDRVAGLFTLANMASLYGIMHINYFRDNFFKNTYMDESEFRQPAYDVALDFRKKLTENASSLVKEGEKAVGVKQNARFLNKLVDFYHNTMVPSVVKGGLPARMMSEATEEVMEEALTDVWKGVTAGLNAIGVNTTEPNEKLDFQFSVEDVLERYGMAFVGGFIGGGIFAGQQKYENWLKHTSIQQTPMDDMKKLVYYIAEGKGQQIKDYYTDWHRRGLLGSKDLGTSLTAIDSIDGKKIVAESTNGKLSQNDIVYRHLINTVDFLEKIVGSEGLRYTKQQLDNLRTTGFNVNPQTLRAQTIIDLGGYTTLQDDLLNLAVEIVKKNDEIQAKIDDLIVPGDTNSSREETDKNIKHNQEIENLKKELDDLRKKRDDILDGKLNYKYALQSLFISDKQLSDAFININKETFAKLKYGAEYTTMPEEQQKVVDKDFENYKATTGKEKIIQASELYYALASRWGQQLVTAADAIKDFNLDTLHSNFNLNVELNSLRQKAKELEKQILELEAKQELTPEERQKHEELIAGYLAIQQQFEAYETLPGRLLALANNDESFSEISKLLLNPDLDAVGFVRVGELLKELYAKAANEKIVLSGDSELNVLYSDIRRAFLSHSTPNSRIQAYLAAKMAESDAIDEQNGAAVGYNWEIMMNSVNGDLDDDVLFTEEPNEHSQLHEDIEGFLNTFLENLGYNNAVAFKAYNNIVNALKTRTKLTDEGIQEFLSYIMPKIGEQSIIDFMTEMDALRANVVYSPMSELLKDFWYDYAGAHSTILDLLDAEEKKLSIAASAGDYELTPMVENDLRNALSILNAVGAIIVGSTNKTNATINSFEYNPVELPVLENKAGLILANDLVKLESRINYLLQLTENNKNRAFQIHERIDKNARSKFLLAITNPAFVSAFERTFHYNVDGVDKPINLKDILTEVSPPNFSFDNLDLIDPVQLQSIWTEFCQRVREELSKTPQFNNDEELAKSLISLMGADIWKLNTTQLSDKADMDIKPVDKLLFLMTISALPARAFYTRYKNVTLNDKFPFAPLFGQEYATYCALAYMARSNLFNTALTLIKENARSEFSKITDEVRREYLNKLSVLRNYFMVPGGAGTGKTTGVVGTIVGMLSDYGKKQYIAIAPKKVQAQRLQTEVGEDCRYMVKDEFMTVIHKNGRVGEYKFNEKTGHTTRSVNDTYNTSLFDSSMDIKVLFIDETTLFTESELAELSNWAVANGVFIAALGDPKQNGAKIHITENVKKDDETTEQKIVTYVSGIEDCMFFSSPMLTSSLRNYNLAKKNNAETMDNILFKAWTILAETKSITLRQLDEYVPDELELKYYEENGKFFGEKIVKDDFDIAAKAIQLQKRGNVAIIYDKSDGKYDALKDQGINIVAFDDMQGDEYDYVLVDIDFADKARAGGSVSKYLLLKNIYTVSQRSKYGTMMKHDNIETEEFHIPDTGSDVEMQQDYAITEGQITRFKAYRKKALDPLKEDNTFYDYFKKITPSAPGATGPSSNGGGGVQEIRPEITIPPTGPTKKVMSTKGIHELVFRSDFKKTEASLEHSLFNVLKRFKSDIDLRTYDEDPSNPNLTLYTELIQFIGSRVRENRKIERNDPIFSKLTRATSHEVTDYLRKFLTGDRELFITEYDGNEKLMIARFSLTENGKTEYIDVPVCTVTSAFVGKYNGNIVRRRSMKFNFGTEFKTLKQLQQEFPGIFYFRKAGVVAYQLEELEQIQGDQSLTDGAIKFLTQPNKNGKTNLGKVVVLVSDEYSDLDVFSDAWQQPQSIAGEKVNLLTHYDQLALVAVHKPLRIDDILAYVDAIKRGVDGSESELSNVLSNSLWEDPEGPIKVLKSLDWTMLPPKGTQDFYKDVYKRKWQILPYNRATVLSKILVDQATQNPEYADILSDIGVFLNTMVEKSGTIAKETHGIVLNGKKDGKDFSIYIAPNWSGDSIQGYIVQEFDTNLKRPADKIGTFDLTSNTIPINQIAAQYLDEFTSLELKREVWRTNGTYQFVDLTPNDQLYVLLNFLLKDSAKAERLTSNLLTTREFCNYVYMDDMAKDERNGGIKFLPGSRFFGEFVGDFTEYVAPIQNVTYSQYEIDESKIEGVGTRTGTSTRIVPGTTTGGGGSTTDVNLQTVKTSISQLNSIIRTYHLGTEINIKDGDLLNMLTNSTPQQVTEQFISQINSANAFSQNNWNGYEIFVEDGKYKVRAVDNHEAWIKSIIDSKIQSGELSGYDINSLTIMDNYLKNRFYVTLSINDSTGNKHNFIIRQENKKFELRTFNSYDSFRSLLELCRTDQDYFKDISDYVHSLVYGTNTSAAYYAKGYNWLLENYYDADINTIDPRARQLATLLNEHLKNRLEQHEC